MEGAAYKVQAEAKGYLDSLRGESLSLSLISGYRQRGGSLDW